MGPARMNLLLQTNDPVLLSYVSSLLDDAGIEAVVFDANISVVEGSIGVFPRRVMVREAEIIRARRVLEEAGLAAELAPMPKP
jgi:Putative prokaryotic signal transducing protein